MDTSTNFHFEYSDITRHWSPASEKYAGGDALMTALRTGWEITGVIFRQEFWHAGVRRGPIYHFELRKGDEVMKMAVIQNPYVTRLVEESGMQVVLMNQRKQKGAERW